MKISKFSIPFLGVALSLTFVASIVLAAGLSWFQGFEADSAGWTSVSRVASGTNLIDSAAGSYHAEATSGDFTRWGGYGGVAGCEGNACAAGFPQHGYVTSVDIYLDASSTAFANDTRFDFSSAINTPAGLHRRDFVFNAGFYNDVDTTGTVPRFVISASNNTGRANSFPKNPGRDPFPIADDGWYTFQHTFLDNGAGVLTVELSIKDAAGTILKTWTLSDPTDIINTNVGSNRYGLFAQQELLILAFDNSSRSDILSTPADKEQCKKDGWRQLADGNGDAFANQGKCVKFVTTGN